jgi:prepilin-type N-terminal cleavage/methylation domain-containing protein
MRQGVHLMKLLLVERDRRAFTMIELMVVVVIVAVLAAIAIPIYGNYIKNARVSEATSRMGEIFTAARVWAQEHENVQGQPVWPSATHGIVDLSSTENFTYAIIAGGGGPARNTTFALKATGLPNGKMAGVEVIMSIRNLYAASEDYKTSLRPSH